jgi:predicted nucleic acid-binding protein
MWKYHSIQNHPLDDLLIKNRQMIEMVDQFIKSEDIYEEAIPLSYKIDHPAYDSMYFITCRRKNSTLITLDKRLIKAANKLDLSIASIG